MNDSKNSILSFNTRIQPSFHHYVIIQDSSKISGLEFLNTVPDPDVVADPAPEVVASVVPLSVVDSVVPLVVVDFVVVVVVVDAVVEAATPYVHQGPAEVIGHQTQPLRMQPASSIPIWPQSSRPEGPGQVRLSP